MRVGVCVTKNDHNAKKYFHLIKQGLTALKHSYVTLRNPKEFKKHYKRLDYIVMFGWFATSGFRKHVYLVTKASNKALITFDVGFYGSSEFLAFSLNGPKGLGYFNNKNSPSDRFDSFKLDVLPWRTQGDHILLLGQRSRNALCSEVNFASWYKLISVQMKAVTDRPIKFRPHPRGNEQDFRWFKRNNVEIVEGSLKDNLINCWASVGLTTNALFESILSGIPIFALHKNSYFYKIGNKHITAIEEPITPDRTTFFNDIGYAQWRLKEVSEGKPFKHLLGL
jgi:hypothetical protein